MSDAEDSVDTFCLYSVMRFAEQQMSPAERHAYVEHVMRCRDCREWLGAIVPFLGEHRETVLRQLRKGGFGEPE